MNDNKSQIPCRMSWSIDEMILEKFPELKSKWNKNRLDTLVVTSECIIELFKNFVNLGRWSKSEYRYNMILQGNLDRLYESETPNTDTLQVPCRVPCEVDEMILEKFPELEGRWEKDKLTKLVDSSVSFTGFLRNLENLGHWCELQFRLYRLLGKMW